MSVTESHFKADLSKLREALRLLEQSTEKCSSVDILTLVEAGHIPRGVGNYLVVLRDIQK